MSSIVTNNYPLEPKTSKSITCFASFYMAPKKNEYPVHLRQTVIKHHLNDDSEHEIVQKLIIPRTSVHYIIDKCKKTKCIQNIIGRGRKRKTTVYLHRAIHRKIKADRRKSASFVKAVIETEFRIIICKQTVRRRLHEAGFKSCVARKKNRRLTKLIG